MKKFEVGKVYKSTDREWEGTRYIRIIKRSDTTVCFNDLCLDGKEYRSDDKFKRIHILDGAERISFDWGLVGFSAENIVDDWEDVVATYLEKERAENERREREREAHVSKQVAELQAFLTENNITPKIAWEIVNRFGDFYNLDIWRRCGANI